MFTSPSLSPGRSALRTNCSSVSTRSIAGTQRRSAPPLPAPPPLVAGASKNVVKRRFISCCSDASSRAGSHRTSAIADLHGRVDRCNPQYRNLSRRLSNVQRRQHPPPHVVEKVLLGLGEVREIQRADARQVRRAGAAQLVGAGVGELRKRAAGVVVAALPADQPVALEPVDE